MAGSIADFVGINCPVPSALGTDLNVALGGGPGAVTMVTYPVHFVVATERPALDPQLRCQLNACIQEQFAKAKEAWCPTAPWRPGGRRMTAEEKEEALERKRVCCWLSVVLDVFPPPLSRAAGQRG